MNPGAVFFLLGRLLLLLGAALLVPPLAALALGSRELALFLPAAVIAGAVGAILVRLLAQPEVFRFGRRDAFVLVAAAWVTASLVGALPYLAHMGPRSLVDALFESASGFTTTGATIVADVEGWPPGLVLWRSITHWLGGMGIIVLGIAILPRLSVGGMELLGAEAPGPTQEKLTPRIAQTAKALWGIYALLTAAEAAALVLLGMGPYEAVNHAMATMATGGFSTRNQSIAAFASPGIEWVVTLFMVLAGANFALHFQLLRGRPGPLLRDTEFRAYLGILGGATLVLAADLLVQQHGNLGLLDTLRHAAFQAVTMVTTTGFATTDFDAWPSFSRTLLFLLMFSGGCAGSTAGSVKVVRTVIVARSVINHLKRQLKPHGVYPIRFSGRPIPDDVVGAVATFLVLYVAVFGVGAVLLSGMGLDVVTAATASAACLGNVGPGLELVGPARTYAPLPAGAKLVLTAEMIVGRLELYTLFVLFFLSGRRTPL